MLLSQVEEWPKLAALEYLPDSYVFSRVSENVIMSTNSKEPTFSLFLFLLPIVLKISREFKASVSP